MFPTHVTAADGEIPLDPSIVAVVDIGAKLSSDYPLVMDQAGPGTGFGMITSISFGSGSGLSRRNPAQASDWCLLVGNDQMASLTILKSEDVAEARQAADKINALALETKSFAQKQGDAIFQARQALDAAEDDQTKIIAARAKVPSYR